MIRIWKINLLSWRISLINFFIDNKLLLNRKSWWIYLKIQNWGRDIWQVGEKYVMTANNSQLLEVCFWKSLFSISSIQAKKVKYYLQDNLGKHKNCTEMGLRISYLWGVEWLGFCISRHGPDEPKWLDRNLF